MKCRKSERDCTPDNEGLVGSKSSGGSESSCPEVLVRCADWALTRSRLSACRHTGRHSARVPHEPTKTLKRMGGSKDSVGTSRSL